MAASPKRKLATEMDERTLVLTRVFDAPRELVFKAWTTREHLMAWSAPHGFTVTDAEGDLRPGGRWRSCMVAPDGSSYWLGGVYREIVPPERLVFTHIWDDQDGIPGEETVVSVTFEDVGGKTRLTLKQALFASIAARDGHSGGWNEALERLGGHLAATGNHAPAA